VAAQLPGPVGDTLLDAGRHAFTHGMSAASLTGAGLMAATAVITVVLMRHIEVAKSTEPVAGTGDGAAATDRGLVHGAADR
jgi:hypothetical protein